MNLQELFEDNSDFTLFGVHFQYYPESFTGQSGLYARGVYGQNSFGDHGVVIEMDSNGQVKAYLDQRMLGLACQDEVPYDPQLRCVMLLATEQSGKPLPDPAADIVTEA